MKKELFTFFYLPVQFSKKESTAIVTAIINNVTEKTIPFISTLFIQRLPNASFSSYQKFSTLYFINSTMNLRLRRNIITLVTVKKYVKVADTNFNTCYQNKENN